MQLAARNVSVARPFTASRTGGPRRNTRLSRPGIAPRSASADIADVEEDDFMGMPLTNTNNISAGEKVKLRVRMRGFDVRILESACDQVVDIAALTGAKAAGPVRLPTKRKVYCVLRSPHVNKDAREHFEIRTHHRLVDLSDLSSQTVQALMEWVPPSGLEVETAIV